MNTKKMIKSNFNRDVIRFAFTILVTGSSVFSNAATVYLKDAHDGKWNNASNWLAQGGAAYGSLPKSDDQVVIPATVTNKKLSISGKVTIQKLQVKALTLTIEKGASLNVNQGSDAGTYTISIATGSVVNNGTLAVYGGAVSAGHNLIQLDGDAANISSTFTNNGKLILDNTAATGTVNKMATLSCFSYNQTTSGTNPVITLNQSGTIDLKLKEAAAQSATTAGFNPQIFNVSWNVKAVLSGTITFGSQTSPLVMTKLLAGGNANSTLTIPAGTIITSYHEGKNSGMFAMFSGNLINAGIITLDAPTQTGLSYGIWNINGIDNSGSITVSGNINGKGVTLNDRSTTATPSYILNSGTFTINLTGKAVGLSAYCGSFQGTWIPGTSVAKTGVFQFTNSGTMTINAAAGAPMAIALGNSDPDSWIKNSGTIKVNNAVVSGFSAAVKTSDGNYYSAPASSPMKIYNSGTFIFDLPNGSSAATKENFNTADGTTSNVNFNYSKPLFINQYNGTGGIVKGKGRFVQGSFDKDNSPLGKTEM